VVTAAECEAVGDESVLVRTGDRLIILQGSHEAAECAADAIGDQLATPYRAVARRREGNDWAVGAVAIEVAELPADTEGDELMLTATETGERALEVDGSPTTAGIEDLERIGDDRYDAYVLRATRIEGTLWEIGVDPL
jgi:hypothetical protein